MPNKILLAYDGSEAAEQVFDLAVDTARRRGASLHVVAVASAAEIETQVCATVCARNARRC